MEQSGFAAGTKINAQAFIDDLIQGDAIGVTSFGAQGVVNFPATGNSLVVVDASLQVLVEADAAVQALTFTDPSINIGGGLQTAYGMFASAPAGLLPGVLLISTGQQNSGTDPTKLSSYQPTWVCAPGPTANLSLLNQIAVLSRGQYYYIPTANDMMTILNQIRGQMPGWQTVFNQSRSIDPLSYWLPSLTLSAGLSQAQFSIVWNNPNLTYTSSSNPAANQVSVTLVQPPGIVLQTPPNVVGAGYCVFNIQNPVSAPGPWYVQVIYPGASGSTTPLQVTAGVFALPTSSTIKLNLIPQGVPKAGSVCTIHAVLENVSERIEIDHATAEVVQRSGKVPFAGEEHSRKEIPMAVSQGSPSTFMVELHPVGGSFNVKAHIRGRLANSNTTFERAELMSIHVPE
jgi:hypothetical protein